MAARAIWKGALRIGDEPPLQVKLYSAAQDRRVHFRLLHAEDHAPVQQRMVSADDAEQVATEQVQRGFEVEPGVFVLLEPEDLEGLVPEASRDVQLLRFVPRGTIDPVWYDRPYWLGPDGDDDAAYFALAGALEESGREGVARWTMRKKSYVGALRVEQGRLLLNTLRRAEEVVPITALEAPGGRELDDREVELAERLLSALEDHFDPAAFRDEYRDRVLAFIESKAKGEAPKLQKPKKKKAERSLVKALEQSLRRAKEPRVA
jgi:DNA end-binding protein Ku